MRVRAPQWVRGQIGPGIRLGLRLGPLLVLLVRRMVLGVLLVPGLCLVLAGRGRVSFVVPRRGMRFIGPGIRS